MQNNDTWPDGFLPVTVIANDNCTYAIVSAVGQRIAEDSMELHGDFAEDVFRKVGRAINSFDTLVEALEILLANPKTGRDRAHAALAAARKPED